MYANNVIFALAALAIGVNALPSTLMERDLGINCRGSGLCPRASFNNQGNVGVLQGLRDAIYSSNKPDDTVYHPGDHVICVAQSQSITISAGVSGEYEGAGGDVSVELSGSIAEGGICIFSQAQGDITLGTIKPLVDSILKHGCGVCGSVPIHFVNQNGNNDPNNGGILTSNYVKSPYCVDNCISGSG